MVRLRVQLPRIILFLIVIIVGIFGFLSIREQRRLAVQDQQSTTPLVLPGDPVRGPSNAAVTIIEYGDYQCAFCRLIEPEVTRMLRIYPQQLRMVWKDFPLTDQHPEALPAARAARCAGEQGAFWEMHDALFEQEQSLSSALYGQLAQQLRLDQQQYQSCMQNLHTTEMIQQSVQDAVQYGVDGTPYFFINGIRVANVASPEEFRNIIQERLP